MLARAQTLASPLTCAPSPAHLPPPAQHPHPISNRGRATSRGLRARQVWLPLPGLVEQRWQERYGADQIARLRRSLEAIVGQPDTAASRGKVARLTSAGLRARRRYLDLLGAVEDRWLQRFGRDAIGALRQSLETLAVGADGQPPSLFQALEPYPDKWRAAVRPPRTLPYYPMVLHRGGYPDGS
jgi:hypothetical protein